MIKYFIMDVDGTLTDGTIYISEKGEAFKGFNVKDGYGIANTLPENVIIPVIMTGRKSEIVVRRCKELKVEEVYQETKNKLEFLKEFISNKDIRPENIAYIGDDLNDYDCMKFVQEGNGITGCPKDAVEKIQSISLYKCSLDGGKGAVREFIDFLIGNRLVSQSIEG